ncbi:nucleoside-diphosphate kinase [Gracilibacillus halotolerans]|uniref:Nucleoside diphosphate kinase n=1 Tax=Gracilibacillus halotolerans TaxID=74386 RepID=A0A841RHZ3_9BACI|nr:nucleoside-diphosphate kinase [Gracilibacillus halotolerans]MBB6511652.1 nucleoside-diphosphate kinase [Gracilibacillus halotolerans]
MEQTFLMIKPDAVQRNLIGTIIGKFEQKGFKLVAAKLMQVNETLAEEHYKEHIGKPFFKGLVEFITSGPVFAMVWEGENIIENSRQLIGKTNPLEAAPGTIRGDYGIVTHRNIIHGSDSKESADREIGLFFKEEEILSYQKEIDSWLR